MVEIRVFGVSRKTLKQCSKYSSSSLCFKSIKFGLNDLLRLAGSMSFKFFLQSSSGFSKSPIAVNHERFTESIKISSKAVRQ